MVNFGKSGVSLLLITAIAAGFISGCSQQGTNDIAIIPPTEVASITPVEAISNREIIEESFENYKVFDDEFLALKVKHPQAMEVKLNQERETGEYAAIFYTGKFNAPATHGTDYLYVNFYSNVDDLLKTSLKDIKEIETEGVGGGWVKYDPKYESNHYLDECLDRHYEVRIIHLQTELYGMDRIDNGCSLVEVITNKRGQKIAIEHSVYRVYNEGIDMGKIEGDTPGQAEMEKIKYNQVLQNILDSIEIL